MTLDDILMQLGSCGRYQVLIYLAISIYDNFPSIWHMTIMAFIGFQPTHHCKVPDGAELNQTIPLDDNNDDVTYKQCEMYRYDNGSYDSQTSSCSDGWHYDPDPIKSSIVTDWDLVCHKNVLPESSMMFFNLGVMFGGLVFGFLADEYGRKKCFVFSCVAQAIVGSLVALSPNFYVFTALRFVVGALEQGVNITGFILAMELFPPKERTIFGVAHEYFWAIGGAFVPIFAYFIRTWRPLQFLISIPTITAIVFWWLIPESVVWLTTQGRIKEAEAILEKAAKFNKRQLPPNCLSQYESKPMLPVTTENGDGTNGKVTHGIGDEVIGEVIGGEGAHKTYTILDCFRTPKIRVITICFCGLWALNTMVYYGLSYNTPNLYGDMYINFFIGQMVEIPSVAFTMFIIYRVGRRWPLFFFHVIGGIVCVAAAFIPKETESGFDLAWLQVTFAMLGKFCINASFTIIYIYGPEIYPTVIRNTGTGIGSMSGRLGGIMFPYINYLSKLNIQSVDNLPLIVFGVFSVVGGCLAIPLPETRHRPLPNSIADVENYDEFCAKHARLHEQDAYKPEGDGYVRPGSVMTSHTDAGDDTMDEDNNEDKGYSDTKV